MTLLTGQRALGSTAKSRGNRTCHLSRSSVWGRPQGPGESAVFSSELVTSPSTLPHRHRSSHAATHQLRTGSQRNCRCTYNPSMAGPLNALSLILQGRRHQDRSEGNKIRQVTSPLVNLRLKHVWKSSPGLREMMQLPPGP